MLCFICFHNKQEFIESSDLQGGKFQFRSNNYNCGVQRRKKRIICLYEEIGITHLFIHSFIKYLFTQCFLYTKHYTRDRFSNNEINVIFIFNKSQLLKCSKPELQVHRKPTQPLSKLCMCVCECVTMHIFWRGERKAIPLIRFLQSVNSLAGFPKPPSDFNILSLIL